MKALILCAMRALLLLFFCLQVCVAQISDPTSIDKSNKFLKREASDDLLGYPNLDEQALSNSQCPRNVELRWQAEVSSSIYSTPLIADINSDGKLDIVVPGFVHNLDILEGADGEKLPGWPVTHQSVVHSSPLHYDIDKDGFKEILLPTYNGEILIFRSAGFLTHEKLTVPRLRVRKNWYVGLSPDHADRFHPDVHDESLIPPPDKVSGSSTNSSTPAPPQAGGTSNSTNIPSSLQNTTSSSQEKPVSGEVNQTLTVGNNTKVDELVEGNAFGTARKLLEADEEVIQTIPEDGWDYDYDDYVGDDDSMWGNEEFLEAPHEAVEEFVDIDAHILCTPVIADIDGDGVDEMVVAASYFFDRDYYGASSSHSDELSNLTIGNYIAGGIVVFDLQTKQVKWKTHLDLSTDTVDFRAYIYSSPTVADLDGNGKLSILVGTSFGFVYALDHDGSMRPNFPLQMGEIQAQVIVADINDDGNLEIVTADTRGNVAAWTPQGKELWEVHLKSLVPQAPTIGDVDGDGKTDIVVPTVSGNIYVLRGKDGSSVPHFPFRTHGRIMAPVLLVNLNKDEKQPGLTLVSTSFDGYLYLIDGASGCADAVDIGETSYSMVLADNVDGGDDLDLIVSTMNGNVYCFQTPVTHHPLKAWPTHAHGRNVMSSRYNREGIFVLPLSRTYRDESGDSFWVSFKIVDQLGLQGPYNVTVTLLVPGNFQGSRRITVSKMYDQPGAQSLKLSCVPMRTTGSVSVEMVDKHGLYFSDEFSLTFHMHYHRLLKWMILSPMVAMLLAFLWLHPAEQPTLPSFSSDRHSS